MTVSALSADDSFVILAVISKLATSEALKAANGPVLGGSSMELVGAIEGMIDLERER